MLNDAVGWPATDHGLRVAVVARARLDAAPSLPALDRGVDRGRHDLGVAHAALGRR